MDKNDRNHYEIISRKYGKNCLHFPVYSSVLLLCKTILISKQIYIVYSYKWFKIFTEFLINIFKNNQVYFYQYTNFQVSYWNINQMFLSNCFVYCREIVLLFNSTCRLENLWLVQRKLQKQTWYILNVNSFIVRRCVDQWSLLLSLSKSEYWNKNVFLPVINKLDDY